MSKREVLEEVYPDEIEMILNRESNYHRQADIKRLESMINDFYASGLFKKEAIQSYVDNICDNYKTLVDYGNTEDNDQELTDEEKAEKGIERLRKMKGTIASTQAQKRRG